MSRLNSAIEKAEKNLKIGKAKKSEIYNLNSLKFNLQIQEIDLLKNIDIANTAFKSFLEIPEDKEFKIKDEIIGPKEFILLPLENYTQLALKNNEQYQRAKHGLNARKALVEYQKVQNNPILFFGFNASYQGKIPFKNFFLDLVYAGH
jgi:outer membrane protein TolC